ncbi:hypothetical protein DY000_02048941 [Brassica cretica]|uniref:Uncharacterized protein n=1 Tax=Brassica cretica TaxID=69181 RepID=A0ABQ7ENM1_BRACR|nr:hypothetical protein DY000_02048941 [Brassica cretica]
MVLWWCGGKDLTPPNRGGGSESCSPRSPRYFPEYPWRSCHSGLTARRWRSIETTGFSVAVKTSRWRGEIRWLLRPRFGDGCGLASPCLLQFLRSPSDVALSYWLFSSELWRRLS